MIRTIRHKELLGFSFRSDKVLMTICSPKLHEDCR